jgi:hypothetical protein
LQDAAPNNGEEVLAVLVERHRDRRKLLKDEFKVMPGGSERNEG